MDERAPRPDDARDGARALFVFAGFAALYWGGRGLGLGAGDGPEHALSALTWGVSRPPGYPLYVALAHAFSLLPLGPALGRVSGFSGLLHAAAAALFFRLLRRCGCVPSVALAATCALGLSPLWWHYSEVPEVRALNDLLALWAALWAAQLKRGGPVGRWAALGAVVGLGLSHHPTFVLLLPALALLAREARPDARRGAALAAAAAAAAAAPYVLLGLRLRLGAPPAFNPDAVAGWGGVLALALRRDSGGLLGMAAGGAPLGSAGFDPALIGRGLARLAGAARDNLTLPGLALAAWGVWTGARARGRAAGFWLLWFACAGPLFVAVSAPQMRFGDADYLRAVFLRFDLLPLIALFALAGLGAQALLARARPEAGRALAAAALLGPLFLRPMPLGEADPLGSYARDLLADSGPRDMILLNSDDSIFATSYLDVVEGGAGDRVFLATGLFRYPPYVARLQARHPDLVLPRNGDGLSRHMKDWLRLNPTRALYGEATLRDALVALSSATAPSGVLIRFDAPRAAPGEDARQTERLLAERAAAFPPGRPPRTFTQEVYLVKAFAMMLEYDAARLTRPADADLRARLPGAMDAPR
jgi:hypothetical protein